MTDQKQDEESVIHEFNADDDIGELYQDLGGEG